MYFDYMMEKEQKENAEEITSFLKLPVYTREGKYVGHVKNVFLDVEEKGQQPISYQHQSFTCGGQCRCICSLPMG